MAHATTNLHVFKRPDDFNGYGFFSCVHWSSFVVQANIVEWYAVSDLLGGCLVDDSPICTGYGKTHVVQSLHHGRKHLHDSPALLGVSHCRLSFCVEHQVTLPQVVAPMGLPQNRCAEPSNLLRGGSGTIRTYTHTSTDQPRTWTRTWTLDEFSGATASSSGCQDST